MEWFDRPPTPPPPGGAAAEPDETDDEHHAAILAAAKEFIHSSGSGSGSGSGRKVENIISLMKTIQSIDTPGPLGSTALVMACTTGGVEVRTSVHFI